MEEKKPAKIVLRDLQDKIAEDVWEAKRRGEKIGWCASNFPQEITTAMDIKVAYPENMGAAIGAKGGGKRMCEEAEAMGYSNDICSYARMNLAYAAHDDCPEIQIPRPDFLLCCNNICGCMMKWYENLALELDIPLFMIDIPHLTEEVCDADRIAYIRAQFDDCIAGLEKLTGKKMDWDKFREVMEVSQRSSKAWLRAMDAMKNTPSPFSGFDTFNNMAVACVGRGTAEAAEAFELLADEYEALAAEGKSTFKGEEKYRILFEGIACWANLKFTYKALQSRGINLTSTIYGPAFSFLYQNMDELMAAYAYVPNSYCFEKEVQLRVDSAIRNKVDGAVMHINRSCKRWSGNTYEMERQLRDKAGIPTMTFDGDQSDPRVFSEAQYDTRVEALMEIMEANRQSRKEENHA
ncbi:MAG: 2-hydroxyacyl-CoA dehydratase [Eubacterium sp.]|nr:2-hydroxyacyl-CoA dehydratase [Eubacterium sp.]MBR3275915.1 2-hydroxyacyl-CoA dehydratase [Eubacterium sp.]